MQLSVILHKSDRCFSVHWFSTGSRTGQMVAQPTTTAERAASISNAGGESEGVAGEGTTLGLTFSRCPVYYMSVKHLLVMLGIALCNSQL